MLVKNPSAVAPVPVTEFSPGPCAERGRDCKRHHRNQDRHAGNDRKTAKLIGTSSDRRTRWVPAHLNVMCAVIVRLLALVHIANPCQPATRAESSRPHGRTRKFTPTSTADIRFATSTRTPPPLRRVEHRRRRCPATGLSPPRQRREFSSSDPKSSRARGRRSQLPPPPPPSQHRARVGASVRSARSSLSCSRRPPPRSPPPSSPPPHAAARPARPAPASPGTRRLI